MGNIQVVNLGGACYTAELLNHFGLRSASLPFDWLYNLDAGLRYVTDILVDDFSRLLDRDAFALSDHPRWPGKQTVINKHYPMMAFVHSSPGEPSEYETLTRRSERLRGILRESDEITFLYYRIWNEPEYRRLGPDRHRAQLEILESEAHYFAERFSANIRPAFRLIAIYMAPAASTLRMPPYVTCGASAVRFETMEPFAYEDPQRARAIHDFRDILERHSIGYSRTRVLKNRIKQIMRG